MAEKIHQDPNSAALGTRFFDNRDEPSEGPTPDADALAGAEDAIRPDDPILAGLVPEKIDDPRGDRRGNLAERDEALYARGPDYGVIGLMQDDVDEEVAREKRNGRPIVGPPHGLQDSRAECGDPPPLQAAKSEVFFARFAADDEPFLGRGEHGWTRRKLVSEWSKFNAIGVREAATFLTFSTLAGAQLSRYLGLTCDGSRVT